MLRTGVKREIMGIFIVLILFSNDVSSLPTGKVDSDSKLYNNRNSRQLDFESLGPCPEETNRNADIRYPASLSTNHRIEFTDMDNMRTASHSHNFNDHSNYIHNTDFEGSPYSSTYTAAAATENSRTFNRNDLKNIQNQRSGLKKREESSGSSSLDTRAETVPRDVSMKKESLETLPRSNLNNNNIKEDTHESEIVEYTVWFNTASNIDMIPRNKMKVTEIVDTMTKPSENRNVYSKCNEDKSSGEFSDETREENFDKLFSANDGQLSDEPSTSNFGNKNFVNAKSSTIIAVTNTPIKNLIL